MYNATFVSEDGSISFGYEAGILFSIDPLGDLDIDLETVQPYQQIGARVESRSISGVTRTISGRILRNMAYVKTQLRDLFAPTATGRLTVGGKYYVDCEVKKTPAISEASRWPTFTLQVYCPSPYWSIVGGASDSTIEVTPAFQLPVCYDSHMFGTREVRSYLSIGNDGLDTQDFELTIVSQGKVVNPKITDINSGEYVRFVIEMEDGDELTLYRENGVLRLVKTIEGVEYNAFENLDETSTLWTLEHGDRIWMIGADNGASAVYAAIDYNQAYTTPILLEG